MKKSIIIVITLLLLAACEDQEGEQQIRLNQLGFYPDAEKIAIVPVTQSGAFEIVDSNSGQTVYEGSLLEPREWEFSGETVSIADFSDLTEPGTYRLVHDELGQSYDFEIRDGINEDLVKAALRALYYNRASTELPEEYAGKWHRPKGHPDTVVYVHASAATEHRPEGYVIESPKGWYDAGDYNKYIVNSGISTYTVMAAYEHFPDFYASLDVNIPETGNGVPDILDEARWNLDWMMTMQDPHDGGVYHKMTTLRFEGILMPHEATNDRYVVKKSTSAALNFAAVMAAASRIYEAYDPDFSAEAIEAAEYAWQWAVENPEIYYVQPDDVHTGQYGDGNVEDEFDWAAAELFITTGNIEYWNARDFESEAVGVPSWSYVRPLAWMSLAHHRDHLPPVADAEMIKEKVLSQGDELVGEYEQSAYRVSKGLYGEGDFVWGSNGVISNHAMMLLQAYKINGDEKYLNAANANLDYVLGRNATGYSFVSGFGSKPPMNPHHRPSEADERNEEPVPGFLMGGPFNGQPEETCEYPSEMPAKSFVDHWCSYSTNEVTINWNAPLIYTSGAIEYFRN